MKVLLFLGMAFFSVVSSLAQSPLPGSKDFLFLSVGSRNLWQKSVGVEYYLKRHQSVRLSFSTGFRDESISFLLSGYDYHEFRETRWMAGYRYYGIGKKRGIFRVYSESGFCFVYQSGEVDFGGLFDSHTGVYRPVVPFAGFYATGGFQINFKYVALETNVGLAKMFNEKTNGLYGMIWPWMDITLGIGIPVKKR